METMNDILAEDFQITVQKYLERNRSLPDILSKLQSSSARLNRTAVKAATQCGCIPISGEKAPCESCRESIEQEMGDVLFYLAALCNSLDMSLYDVLLREKKALSLLGNFSLK